MTGVTLGQANHIITLALQKGQALGLKSALTVAVLDAGGHLIALQRQDGASVLRPAMAIGQAMAHSRLPG